MPRENQGPLVLHLTASLTGRSKGLSRVLGNGFARFLEGGAAATPFPLLGAAGQQTSMQDSTGVTSFSYDLDGRKTNVQYPSNVGLTYSYDSRHEVARLIVTRAQARRDRVSHHPYPTRKIESPRTTYPVPQTCGSIQTARGGCGCQH